MEQGVFTLVLGFVLGIKHAFEADHIVAVSTIVTSEKHPVKAALIGTFWGIGHTLTLFVIGIVVFLLKVKIPQGISLGFEFLVGGVLVILGMNVLRTSSTIVHSHTHTHDGTQHEHVHFHKNSFHKHHKSFIVGLFHGLAGSGALMLLVLSTLKSTTQALYYILLFGTGSVLGMTLMSFVIGIPILYSTTHFPQLERFIKIIAGTLSIGFGIVIMSGILVYLT